MQNSNFFIIVFCIAVFAFNAVVAHSATLPVQTDNGKNHEQHRSLISEDSVKWRRDPFGDNVQNKKAKNVVSKPGMKTAASITAAPDLNIQGIMQTDSVFNALINGRVVKAGEKLDGVTILEISRYQVTIQNDNKEKSVYDIYQGRIDRGKK